MTFLSSAKSPGAAGTNVWGQLLLLTFRTLSCRWGAGGGLNVWDTSGNHEIVIRVVTGIMSQCPCRYFLRADQSQQLGFIICIEPNGLFGLQVQVCCSRAGFPIALIKITLTQEPDNQLIGNVASVTSQNYSHAKTTPHYAKKHSQCFFFTCA